MINEIKEIIEYLKNPDFYVEDFGFSYKRISLDETNILLDYITNLQNEIFDLKDTIQNKNDCIGAYECIIEDRDKRIDKTIKYCEESSKTIKSEYFSDVLKILKGDK